MSAVPSRQVLVLCVQNYDDIRLAAGPEAASATLRAVQEYVGTCTQGRVTPDHMRVARPNIALVRMDDLSCEEFVDTIQAISAYVSVLDLSDVVDGSATIRLPIHPRVALGAIDETAMRESANDLAIALLAYMEHANSDVTFLSNNGQHLLEQLETASIDFVSYDQLATTDSFTGLLRPAGFARLLQDVLNRPELMQGDCAVLYFDLDEFKSYNRVFGRAAGDELLHFIADTLREVFSGDILTHIAIDRFAVLTNKHNVEAICERVHDEVRRHTPAFAPQLKCGIYVPHSGEADANIAMDYAKIACERIKGRFDTVCNAFDGELRERMTLSQYVSHHVERAVASGWIKPFYQPVVDATTGELCGWEALCRWVDPVQGILSPATFIPVLEETHLIHKVDTSVVGQVCRDLGSRLRAGKQVVPVSINLSRLDFQLCDIYKVIEEQCKKWEVPHELLVIEVTESALSTKDAFLREQMDRFRAAGHEVWMDDFGSGYSTLNLLKDYEFDVLKVDMEFLNGMEDNDRSRTIVAAVIAMAQKLGLRTLVEGVRTPAQRDYLRELGCNMLQGYLFDVPRRLDDPLLNWGPY